MTADTTYVEESDLTGLPPEWARYERQIRLSEIGLEGQRKLEKARVLVVGAGGLGSPVLLYLAGAGIGTIGIIDADEVSISNLHRQVIHPAENIGINKAESARERILAINDRIKVHTYPFFLTPENIGEILPDYDFVIDAVDNFEAKFLINDACVLAGKPFCHGGVIRFRGQILTYVPGKGPCFRCIFEEIPECGSVPTAAQVGILGMTAGIIGSMQALEAVKYFTGAGELLTGRMLIFDGLTMKTRIAAFPKASETCRVCGPDRKIRSVLENHGEYEQR